jgi:2-C-methyl-D-erythritol 4-phosphate cytidylyltransferase
MADLDVNVVDGGAPADVPAWALIVPAAGAGTRMRSDTRKPWLELAGEPILHHTLRRFVGLPGLARRIVVAAPGDVDRLRRDQLPVWREEFGVDAVTAGGAERVDSVELGLEAVLAADCGATVIAVHDAVRPLVTPDEILRTVATAHHRGAALLAARVVDTLKRESPGEPGLPPATTETVSRVGLWSALTPQAIRVELFFDAYRCWAAAGKPAVTDDVSLVERLGLPVGLVEGSRRNIKITTPDDLPLAAGFLAAG